ncbi:MAG: FAD-dependent oxidoreductase [Nitrospirae bacterium]|nr:FAD-dependent oxidoreductase [Nitrospirota bacterium]
MQRYDVVIIGAGISGLSLAHYCAKQGLRTLVLEKDGRVGGTFHTHVFPGADPGFWLELGAHTCYNSYGNLLNIMEELSLLHQAAKKEKVGYKLLVDGRIQSIPSRMNFAELLFSAPRLFTLKKAGHSIESYYSKIVGKNNFRKVFGPLFDAVICQKADNFPADLLFKKRDRRKDVLKSFAMRRGLQSITEAIASEEGIEVVTGKAVDSILFKGGLFTAGTADGASFQSPVLAVAAQASAAAALLRTSFPEISALLSRIEMGRVETVGVAIRKDSSLLGPLAGIIAVDNSFYSAVSRDPLPDENRRGFAFHFKSGAATLESRLARIAEVLQVKREELEGAVSAENHVPALRVGHDALVTELDRLLARRKLLLTGNYFSGLAIEDCVSRSLSEFGRLRNSPA